MCRILELVKRYVSFPCFQNSEGDFKSPWQRHIPLPRLNEDDFKKPLEADEFSTARSLLIHRLLFNIYEQDLLFLPHGSCASLELFQVFYGSELREIADEMRPKLEELAFHSLSNHVKISGKWTFADLTQYFSDVIEGHEATKSQLCDFIHHSKDPLQLLKEVFKQQAPDALSEASGMSRYLGGSYGAVQSGLAKVFVDEFGFGVHQEKHSTLFEELLTGLGLDSKAHAYFSEYSAASLCLANYFHYISLNKRLFFKYTGAIYFAEASLPHVNRQMLDVVKRYAPEANYKYFEEHAEIDVYHRKMVLNDVLKPIVENFGDKVIPDIVSGFEEFRVLLDFAAADFAQQNSLVLTKENENVRCAL